MSATHRKAVRWAALRRSVILPFFVLSIAGVALADEEAAPERNTWGFQLSRELMSPYCPGRTLADCPSSQADELKLWIYEQEKQGRTRAEVEQDLLERFGEKMLGAPRAYGFGLAAYWVPAVLFVFGGWIALRFLRRQKIKNAQVAVPEATPAVALDPEIARILEEEMRQ